MKAPHAITVYCSSSSEIHSRYHRAATELGEGIARHGWTLVYGGNYLGCMAAVANGARAAGGRVVGITPKLMAGKGYDDKKCCELIVTADMRERKALLEARGDGFVAMPGGIGTLEELTEVIVGRLLHYHDKPIVILNLEGFYDGFLEHLERSIRDGFIKPRIRQVYHVAATVADALQYLSDGREPSST